MMQRICAVELLAVVRVETSDQAKKITIVCKRVEYLQLKLLLRDFKPMKLLQNWLIIIQKRKYSVSGNGSGY